MEIKDPIKLTIGLWKGLILGLLTVALVIAATEIQRYYPDAPWGYARWAMNRVSVRGFLTTAIGIQIILLLRPYIPDLAKSWFNETHAQEVEKFRNSRWLSKWTWHWPKTNILGFIVGYPDSPPAALPTLIYTMTSFYVLYLIYLSATDTVDPRFTFEVLYISIGTIALLLCAIATINRNRNPKSSFLSLVFSARGMICFCFLLMILAWVTLTYLSPSQALAVVSQGGVATDG